MTANPEKANEACYVFYNKFSNRKRLIVALYIVSMNFDIDSDGLSREQISRTEIRETAQTNLLMQPFKWRVLYFRL